MCLLFHKKNSQQGSYACRLLLRLNNCHLQDPITHARNIDMDKVDTACHRKAVGIAEVPPFERCGIAMVDCPDELPGDSKDSDRCYLGEVGKGHEPIE